MRISETNTWRGERETNTCVQSQTPHLKQLHRFSSALLDQLVASPQMPFVLAIHAERHRKVAPESHIVARVVNARRWSGLGLGVWRIGADALEAIARDVWKPGEVAQARNLDLGSTRRRVHPGQLF